MKFDVWPIGPLIRLLSALAHERKELSVERAALRSERETLAAQIAAARRDAEREREALRDEMEYVAAELDETRGRLQFERDVLVMRRDGLESFLTDPGLESERRLAVCELAIAEGRIAEVMSILEPLRDDPAHRPMAARGLALCNQLLRSGLLRDLGWSSAADSEVPRPIALPFRYSPPAAAASRKVVLAFLGIGTRFWMQLSSLHQFLAPFGHHVVYLRDTQWACFLRGADGFDPGYAAALDGLRALCGSLGEGEPQIYCYGASMGGLGALRYGLDLGACRVLAIETLTTLTADVCRAQDERWLRTKLGDLVVDFRALYLEQPSSPQVTLYYGALNSRDALHARRFADVPRARVVPVADSGDHDCLGKLIAEERFPEILTEFLGGDRDD
jgi:hypothetical protein